MIKELICLCLLIGLTTIAVAEHFLADCKKIKNGRYAIGHCQSRYLKCSDGFPHFGDCPEKMVFDEYTRKCAKRANVESCDGDEFEEFTEAYSGEQDETKMKLKNEEVKLSIDDMFANVCEDLEDGKYASGVCSMNYFTCTSKIARFRSCWPFYYDATLKECSERALIKDCQILRNGTNTQNSGSSFVNGEFLNGNRALMKYCAYRNDGEYPVDECSDFFLTCYGWVAQITKCSDPHVFDPEKRICEHPSNVTMCEFLRKPLTNCDEDGFFAVAECSPLFTICRRGVSFDMSCPSNLMFSQETESCVDSMNIRECPKTNSVPNTKFMELLVSTMHEFETSTETKSKICYPNFVLTSLILRQKHGFDLKLESFNTECLRKIIRYSLQRHERDQREIEDITSVVFLLSIVLGILFFFILLACLCGSADV
ncbi:hypothetical protein GCK72_009839 [Caenorhabditis remanei]|uniref:Chitin-binding type-2 domain-containing protein n=1 Tax=Caenorhabditis remanei TaxID=31234 RepID=A0A6A5H501_CAERE|nr:hypothetical protein GCK72_009839 [Caenorhabditis remanei]KAF1761583.1 hypothetical protein GCK72_009839 [Caenorhabditis remanei]